MINVNFLKFNPYDLITCMVSSYWTIREYSYGPTIRVRSKYSYGLEHIHNEFHTPDIQIQVNFTFLEDSEEVVHCMCAKFEKKSNLLFGVRPNTANDLLSALRTYNVHTGSFIFIVIAHRMDEYIRYTLLI